MSDEVKKKVDESWKEQAEEDKKEEIKEEPTEEETTNMPEVNFTTFISSFAMQAMVFLGMIPNPVTNKVEKELNQAKYMIDTINMLEEKTKGNLTKEEQELFKAVLYDLRVKYVEATNKAE